MTEEDEDDKAYITAKDFMNDYATEEFTNKNIRVRPMSGLTRGEEDGKTNDANKSNVNEFGQKEDNDFEFNEMRVIDMDD